MLFVHGSIQPENSIWGLKYQKCESIIESSSTNTRYTMPKPFLSSLMQRIGLTYHVISFDFTLDNNTRNLEMTNQKDTHFVINIWWAIFGGYKDILCPFYEHSKLTKTLFILSEGFFCAP